MPSAKAEAGLRMAIKARLVGLFLFFAVAGTVGTLWGQFDLGIVAGLGAAIGVSLSLYLKVRPWRLTEVRGPGLKGCEAALVGYFPRWVILIICLGL
ncbi:MAG TPA: hypothetical protein VJ873_00770, partial [bacterium]|nr:hypothetical protein [bacterium]